MHLVHLVQRPWWDMYTQDGGEEESRWIVNPRTVAPPPTDKTMWRRLLRMAHPDTGGDHDLYIWVGALREHVAGDHIEEPPPRVHREPPKHKTTGERVPFTEAFSSFHGFGTLTAFAVEMAEDVGEPYASLLRLLSDCREVPPRDVGLFRQQNQGATYRSLAAVGHRVGMSKAQRSRWYRIAEQVPLSQRHASHILSRLG